MKRLAIAALAAPLIIAPTVAFAESKTFDVATFHGVDVAAGIHANVAGGTPLSVVADTANARDFDDLRVEVRGGILHVWREWSLGDLFNWNRPNITVTVGTEILDQCLQFHGGAGYIEEYRVGRAWRDQRLLRIGGGTTETMRYYVAKLMGL